MSQRKALDDCRTYSDFRRHVECHPNTVAVRITGSHLIVRSASGQSACVPAGHHGDLPTGTRRSVVKQLAAIGLVLLPFVCLLLARPA